MKMHTYLEFSVIVNDFIKQHLFENIQATPEELFLPIEYTMDLGGKRVRPLLALIICEMFGGNIDDAIYPAMGLEVFHNFTLLHDDIMDNAPIRRGKETVYKKWNANIAILSGDAMLSLAYHHLINTKNEYIKPILERFNIMSIAVCKGQQYYMNFEQMEEVSIEQYMEMIYFKTAALIAGAAEIGAITGGASKQNSEHIAKYAKNIGLAFQLQDDWLDVYGNEQNFGKVLGGDIACNKKTFLYLKALEITKKEDEKDFDTLKKYFSSTDFNPKVKFDTVKNIFSKHKINEITAAKITQLLEEAQNELNAVDVPQENKKQLIVLTEKLVGRNN